MENIIFDKPILNKSTPEENLAVVDKWIADTTYKLNFLMNQLMKEEEK